MANRLTASQRAANHRARLAWLRPLMAQVPGAIEDIDDVKRAALDDAYTRMVRVGLYAPTSERKGTRWGIRLLISELRGEHVPNARQRYRS